MIKNNRILKKLSDYERLFIDLKFEKTNIDKNFRKITFENQNFWVYITDYSVNKQQSSLMAIPSNYIEPYHPSIEIEVVKKYPKQCGIIQSMIDSYDIGPSIKIQVEFVDNILTWIENTLNVEIPLLKNDLRWVITFNSKSGFDLNPLYRPVKPNEDPIPMILAGNQLDDIIISIEGMEFKNDEELNDYIQSKLPEGSFFNPKQKIGKFTNFSLLLNNGCSFRAILKP